MSRSIIISNFILFQIGWFACVLGGANNMPLAGSLIAVLVMAIHVWRASVPAAEMMLIAAALIIGISFESMMTLIGVNQYNSGIVVQSFAPHWMVMMWGLFATTINVSMRWVKALPLWTVALSGAILAPLSYMAGNRLGGVTFSDTTTALLLISAGWVILFPLLVVTAKRYNGYIDNEAPPLGSGRYSNV